MTTLSHFTLQVVHAIELHWQFVFCLNLFHIRTGQETTSNACSFVIYLLNKNPNVLARYAVLLAKLLGHYSGILVSSDCVTYQITPRLLMVHPVRSHVLYQLRGNLPYLHVILIKVA